MLGGGKWVEGGGKWGKGGREVGERGEGSGDKGGGKWRMPTPLSTPSYITYETAALYLRKIKQFL